MLTAKITIESSKIHSVLASVTVYRRIFDKKLTKEIVLKVYSVKLKISIV